MLESSKPQKPTRLENCLSDSDANPEVITLHQKESSSPVSNDKPQDPNYEIDASTLQITISKLEEELSELQNQLPNGATSDNLDIFSTNFLGGVLFAFLASILVGFACWCCLSLSCCGCAHAKDDEEHPRDVDYLVTEAEGYDWQVEEQQRLRREQ